VNRKWHCNTFIEEYHRSPKSLLEGSSIGLVVVATQNLVLVCFLTFAIFAPASLIAVASHKLLTVTLSTNHFPKISKLGLLFVDYLDALLVW
jgi:hypothetical protein